MPPRPARSARPGIGLALGSGGARGWCHIGVLRELDALGLRPAVVTGCSMGALVGAVWAAGLLDALEEFALSLTPRRVFALLDPRLSGGGLIGGHGIEALLDRLGLGMAIENLPLPFAAVATDLSSGEEIWLRQGPVLAAVRASIAMPGVIAPKQLDGRWLIDGGVVNPIPVSTARALGAGLVLAVDPNARNGEAFWHPQPARMPWLKGLRPASRATAALPAGPSEAPPAMLPVMATTIDLMSDRIRRSRLAGDAPDMLLGARLRDMTVLDFHRAAEAIAEGRRIARSHAAMLSEWQAAQG